MDLNQLLSCQLSRYQAGVDQLVQGIAHLETVIPSSYEKRIEANLRSFCEEGCRTFSYEELALLCSIALDKLAMQHVAVKEAS